MCWFSRIYIAMSWRNEKSYKDRAILFDKRGDGVV